MTNKLKIIIVLLVILAAAVGLSAAYSLDIIDFSGDTDNGGDNNEQNETPPLPTYKTPVAVAYANRTRAEVNENISFDASASYDEDDNIVSYHWDFDDGSSSENITLNHSFAQSGTYNVTLTVRDEGGHTNITWIYIGIIQREHHSGSVTSGTDGFDFFMDDMPAMIYANSTVQNSFTDPETTNVTLRLYYNGTVVWNETVDSTNTQATTVRYYNDTNLSAGQWRWEIEINGGSVLPDSVDWQVDVVIVYV